ncbi:MAG TPA: response regulator transcription factor [Pseudonocardiaceae bacterium]|jgi:DNA-binding response OmpR family regulator|nr:response regulator transcription factor [Pseudonocardiaceae bacterium]
MGTILLVADDMTARAGIRAALAVRGYTVRLHNTELAELRWSEPGSYDLVILDLQQAGPRGERTLRRLRALFDVPIMVATPLDHLARLRLLASGADHCVAKPLPARLLASQAADLLRRAEAGFGGSQSIQVGELYIDLARHSVRLRSRFLCLTRREFELLTFLARRAGKVVSRQDLLRSVWRTPDARDYRVIDVHVSRLRKKLGEAATRPQYLHTVRGVGLTLAQRDEFNPAA